MIFNVESVSDKVNQPTHGITPSGSIINKEQVIKEIAERISSSTNAGVTESQLDLQWAELKKWNHGGVNNGMESTGGTRGSRTSLWKNPNYGQAKRTNQTQVPPYLQRENDYTQDEQHK